MSADGQMATMPLLEHIRELRDRLIWSVGTLFVGMLVALVFSRKLIAGLTDMCSVCQFIVIRPTESVIAYFRVALVMGLVVAMPMILYQTVSFVLPALHKHEKRYLYVLLPGAALLFATGVAFGYYIVLPRTINFLATFLVEEAAAAWSLSNYIAFVTNMLVVIGVTFQTPLVVYLLAKLGIVTPATMSRYRRHAILIIAIIAAVLTPTPDPFTMLLVAVPMVILYELGIVLARLA
ncbi:MAG: twin-arginine translocase subunit TatC [Anaerolineae bacterium]